MIYFGKMLKYAFCIVACFNYLISSAQGIQDSLFLIPEVEVSGTRIFQKDEAGTKTTTVDSVVLLEKINVSLSSVLAENSPVYIKDYGRGALATASFRGTSPSHTQVSWNGINVNSPMLGMVDFSLIPVYVVDEMNLLHGAASVGSQSGGLGGQINIKNNVDWQNRFSGRYYQGIGSFGTFDEFGQVNVGNRTWQSKTRAYHNYSKNNYEFLNKNIIPPEKQRNTHAAFGKYGVVQEFYYKPAIEWQMSGKIWLQNANRAIPTVTSDESADGSKEKINDQTDQTLKAVANANYYADTYTLRFASGIDMQQLDYVNGYTINDSLNLNTQSFSNMQSWHNRADVEWRVNSRCLIKSNFQYNRYEIKSRDKIRQSGYEVVRNEVSAFAGTYFELNKHFQLSANIRKDWVDELFTPFIYSVGINYRPLTKQNWVIKSNVSRNFRNPTLNDMYWQPGGNPALKPEKGYTWETGMHYAWQNRALKMETQLTVYRSIIHNWIIWLPGLQSYWVPQNLEKVESKGVEAMLKLSYNIQKTKLYVLSNYTYTSTVSRRNALTYSDISNGKQLPFIPLHSANLFFTASNRGFYITFQHNTYSKRNLLYTNNQAYTLYAYHLNHASVGKSWKVNQFTFDTELKIDNLFDEYYRSVLNRFMPGRSYTVMVKIML